MEVFFFLIDLRGGEKETWICSSTYLHIHFLILVRALTWDGTCNCGVLGQHPNRLML